MAKATRRVAPQADIVSITQTNGYPNVQYTREELRRALPQYERIVDCIFGTDAIKSRGDKYLPRPNVTDTSPENQARYNAYLARAVFYNVTKRTVFALAGQIFLREPQIDLPEALKPVVMDANGENVPIEQHAEITCRYTFAFGRAGLLGDFPTVGGDITIRDLAGDDIRPVITAYRSQDIINWRKSLRGAKTVYTLIVLREPHTRYDNGFAAITSWQYRVLRLVSAETAASVLAASFPNGTNDVIAQAMTVAVGSVSDVYYAEIWREVYDEKDNYNGFVPVEQYFPTDKNGNFLDEIPFQFIGSERNDDTIDIPPVGDLADLNIAHYRNSADYEETSFLTGQPTPFVSGITQEWATDVLGGKVQLGSRGVIPLPSGGTAGLLQAAANSVPFEAMQHKERQMVALGAKLVEQRQVQRTATEAEMEASADTSVLATIAKNVSNAYQTMLRTLTVFTGDDPEKVFFSLNAEFDLTRMDANERAQLILEWQAGAITTEEMRANMRRGGVGYLSDKDYAAQVAKDEAARMEKAQQKADMAAASAQKAKGADPNNPPGKDPGAVGKDKQTAKGN